MSAFQVSGKHILAIIGYGFEHYGEMSRHFGQNAPLPADRLYVDWFETESLQRAADALAAQNVRSLAECYDVQDFVPVEVVVSRSELLENKGRYSAVEMVKLTQCYDYQACETKDYETTAAAEIVKAIRGLAISKLPGYDAAPWFLGDEPEPEEPEDHQDTPLGEAAEAAATSQGGAGDMITTYAVSRYQRLTRQGEPICEATQVRCPDGVVVQFLGVKRATEAVRVARDLVTMRRQRIDTSGLLHDLSVIDCVVEADGQITPSAAELKAVAA